MLKFQEIIILVFDRAMSSVTSYDYPFGLIHYGSIPGKFSVDFFPCIYSMLKYIREHAHRHDVTTIITFAQPLWWKALMIILTEPIESDSRDIVFKLGCFHTKISFHRCIGHLMAASGLQELLELIYAPNTVVHMLSGKAVALAVQGHLIVDAALKTLVLAQIFNVPVP